MERTVGRKLEMAVRVRDFVRAHPFSDPTHAALATRFDDAVARAQAVAVREQTGRLDARAAVRNRKALRRQLQRELIRYVSRVGEVAARESPELAGRFTTPSKNVRDATFLARGWDLVALVKANQELLGAHGLAGSQVEDLAGALTRFEAATEKANGGRRDHVGARAELLSIVAELMELCRLLDTLIRMQHRNDPELVAAWQSARNVAGPFRTRLEEESPDASPEPPSDAAETDQAA